MNATDIRADEPPDLSPLEGILERHRGQRGALISVLQQAQKIYGYLPAAALRRVAERMRVPVSRVYGVATFYSQFYLTRRGRHIVRQCDGTACHVRGAGKIVERMTAELDIPPGGTTADYRVTCEVVYCLGSCGLAPVAVVDEKIVGQMTPEKMGTILKRLA
jgi:NADH-quinone oxidoreductase subunit E